MHNLLNSHSLTTKISSELWNKVYWHLTKNTNFSNNIYENESTPSPSSIDMSVTGITSCNSTLHKYYDQALRHDQGIDYDFDSHLNDQNVYYQEHFQYLYQ